MEINDSSIKITSSIEGISREHKFKNKPLIFFFGISIIISIFIIQFFLIESISNNNQIILSETFLTFSNYFAIPTTIMLVFGIFLTLKGLSNMISQLYFLKINNSIRSYHEGNKFKISYGYKNLIKNSQFWIFFFGYFIIFMIFSNHMILDFKNNLSSGNNIQIPSFYILGCCGFPGTFPVFSIYITDSIGFLITPDFIIFGSFLSFLVAINFKILKEGRKLKSEKEICSNNIYYSTKLLPSFIAIPLSMLIACPTCGSSLLFFSVYLYTIPLTVFFFNYFLLISSIVLLSFSLFINLKIKN